MGELLAGLVSLVPSPVAAVGSAVIDFAPPGAKDVAVSLFGTADKPAIQLLVTAIVVLAGAGIGVANRRRPMAARLAIGAIVVAGALASARVTSALAPVVAVAAAVEFFVGVEVLARLSDIADLALASSPASAMAAATQSPASAMAAPRRQFLLGAAALGVAALAGGGLGRWLVGSRAASIASSATGGGTGTAGTGGNGSALIPSPVHPVPTPPPDASFTIDGLTPLIVPNADFYRIDTALITPSVDLASWRLWVHGMVDHELHLTFADLMALPLIERYVTISCVSNEVGGNLVGNAKWTGVKLQDVLDQAGVQTGATQIVPTSADGWSAGFPTAWIHDPAHPRDAMIAVLMNGQPLPVEHGYPARLIVPGLYGYVSATKWLTEIMLTTLEAFDAYWVPRGWAKEAPILTQSRIDVPHDGAQVKAGTVAVAGVAWAPDRGISKVELSVDGGAWQPAILATELSAATWVQWKLAWNATPGQHSIEVRATDGTGAVQTAEVTPPDPDGARGHHKIAVSVA